MAFDYLHTFFPWFADRYPDLRHLTLFINCLPLDFLLQMRFLRSLRFTGFSMSPPTAVKVIFQSLKHLEELEVFGPPPDTPTYLFNPAQRHAGHAARPSPDCA